MDARENNPEGGSGRFVWPPSRARQNSQLTERIANASRPKYLDETPTWIDTLERSLLGLMRPRWRARAASVQWAADHSSGTAHAAA